MSQEKTINALYAWLGFISILPTSFPFIFFKTKNYDGGKRLMLSPSMLLSIALSSVLAYLLLELLGTKALLFAFLFLGIFLLTLHFLCLKHLNALQAKIENELSRQSSISPFEAHTLERTLKLLVEPSSTTYPPCRILHALKELLKGKTKPKNLAVPRLTPFLSFYTKKGGKTWH